MRNEIKWYVHVVIGRQFAIPFQVTRKSDYSLILVSWDSFCIMLGNQRAPAWCRRSPTDSLRICAVSNIYLLLSNELCLADLILTPSICK